MPGLFLGSLPKSRFGLWDAYYFRPAYPGSTGRKTNKSRSRR